MEKLTITATKLAVRTADGLLLLELEIDEDRGLEITYTNIYINTEEDINMLADVLKKALSFYKKDVYGN